MEGGKKIIMAWTPSEEDFARAKRKMAERDRHLVDVSRNVMARFLTICPLYKVFTIWQRDVDFRAYVFFKKDADVVVAKRDGTTIAIEDAVYEELERFGRGKRGEIVVAFEYDSDENVDRIFNGDYLSRLR